MLGFTAYEPMSIGDAGGDPGTLDGAGQPLEVPGLEVRQQGELCTAGRPA
jgi:hypothetical protein